MASSGEVSPRAGGSLECALEWIDRTGCADVVARCAASIRGFGISASDPDFEDAVQSTYLLWIERQAGIENPVAWFVAVVRRKLVRAAVARRRELALDAALLHRLRGRDTPIVSRIAAQGAIRLLTPTAALALRLRYIDGCTVLEVATRMGISHANAKKILTRALARLRLRLRGRALQ